MGPSAEPPRSYTIIGVGGVGGYYGARLAAAGHPVRWVARSDAGHLRRHGLRVRSPKGDLHLADLDVYGPGEAPPPADVVVVATKALDNASIAPTVAAAVGPATVVVVLQNGLGVEAPLAEALPGTVVLGAMSFICAVKAGPGEVHHLDYEAVTVGRWAPDGRAAGVSDEVVAVVADLAGAGVPAEALEDLEAGRWRKLVWNVPFNGLSVVLDAPTDRLVGDPSARELVVTLMDEVTAAAAACGHPVPEDTAARMLANTEAMTSYAPSMKVDHDARRPLELDAIYAAPLAAAAEAGAAMPVTAALHAQLAFLDHRRRGVDGERTP
jgi:2-dehydropantoate 2-reductase